MKNESQSCQNKGYEGQELNYICTYLDCNQSSRFICVQCINQTHIHDKIIKYHVEIQNFMEFFKVQRQPQLQQRIQSQNGNQSKCNYLQKIYERILDIEDNFDDHTVKYYTELTIVQFDLKIRELKQIIQQLIDGYKIEMRKVEPVINIHKQLTDNGLASLNYQQLNILLKSHREFINNEINHYQNIVQLMKKLDIIAHKFYNQELFGNKLELLRKLGKIMDYVEFQQIHQFEEEQFMNDSFISRNQRYFALITNNNQLRIRNQNTLRIIQQLEFNIDVMQIRFDPQFKYFILQDYSYNFYFYFSSRNKRFKIIKSSNLKYSIDNFFIQNLNKIIMFLTDKQVIKIVNFKIKCINTIRSKNQEDWDSYSYCYGSYSNIIAINIMSNQELIQIYKDTEKDPFINNQIFYGSRITEMKLINNDNQLLTQNKNNVTLWQIDYEKQQLIQINQITKNRIQDFLWHFTDQTEFVFIKSTKYSEIKILDKNFNLWFEFSIDIDLNECQQIYLTKSLLIISIDGTGKSQVIQRKLRTDYEELQL